MRLLDVCQFQRNLVFAIKSETSKLLSIKKDRNIFIVSIRTTAYKQL